MSTIRSVPSGAVHVAVAVVVNDRGEVLITRRHANAHQGGLWEFPGGKVEVHEDLPAALCREIREELDIEIERARPLLGIDYAYSDKRVYLDVWRVQSWRGTPQGREGQPLAWVSAGELGRFRFPPANLPIVKAVQLPPLYLITPEPAGDPVVFLRRLESCLQAGVSLVQLRAKTLPHEVFVALARPAIRLCRRYGGRMLLNCEPALAADLGADGVHLTSARLCRLRERPPGPDFRVAASCHGADEIEHARRIGADFVVIAPVRPTLTHPGQPALGWRGFADLAAKASLPAYALGGMRPDDMQTVWQAGGQGIAMVSGIWGAADPQAVIAGCLD